MLFKALRRIFFRSDTDICRNQSAMKLLVLFFALSVPAFAQQPAESPSIPNPYIKNFHKVDDRFYRGAQPDPAHLDAAMSYLKSIGIGRVIDLRGRDDLEVREEAAAKKAGLEFKSVPLPGLSAPPPDTISEIKKEVDCETCSPVFIHCLHGQDRTGTIAAIYRIDHGWTDSLAIDEMRRLGDSIFEFGMRRFVHDYYRIKKAASAATSSKPLTADSKSDGSQRPPSTGPSKPVADQ
jgi:tyrosine-protein phosphatase SIW14